jgi:BirA family biotin operon repressor/biotin-[acetyl-CoA-carboxylase] ligase
MNPQEVPGLRMIVLHEVPSTNLWAKEALRSGEMVPGDAVLAHYQSAGRGQRNKGWWCPSGEGLLMSIALKTNGLQSIQGFWIGAMAAMAVRTVLATAAPSLKLTLKWPNDILSGQRKLGGLLAEHGLAGMRIEWSVVGIGINLHQTAFPAELPHATSVAGQTGLILQPEVLGRQIAVAVHAAIDRLRSGFDPRATYQDQLWGMQVAKSFYIEGQWVYGIPKALDAWGRLGVEVDGKTHFYDVGQLKWAEFA